MCHQQFLILLKKPNLKHLISHFVHSIMTQQRQRITLDGTQIILYHRIFAFINIYSHTYTYFHPPQVFPTVNLHARKHFSPTSPCFPSNWEMSPKFSRLTCIQKFLHFYMTELSKIMLTNLLFFCLPNHNKVVLYCKITSRGVNT